jgi:hypothetical protein
MRNALMPGDLRYAIETKTLSEGWQTVTVNIPGAREVQKLQTIDSLSGAVPGEEKWQKIPHFLSAHQSDSSSQIPGSLSGKSATTHGLETGMTGCQVE